MQLFKYKGYDENGKKVEGELAGASIEEVERKVAAQSVTIIAIIPAGAARRGQSGEVSGEGAPQKAGRKKVSDADVATILRDLSVMAETGVPFIDALDAVIASARTAPIAEGLKTLKSEIVGGKGLSAGMRAAPGLFPGIVCDMVRVAEEGGRLDKALASASTYVERAADLKKRVMNALLYPIVLTVIAFITVTVLIAFVLPRFAGIFKTMGADVPATTQIMLSAGEAIRNNPIVSLGVFVGTIVGVKVLWGIPSVNRVINTFLLKVPVLGELLRRLALSRAFQSIATLLGSNVPLLAALEHGARVAGNPVVYEALMKARVGVEHGAPFSESLAETKVFPPQLIQMVTVGERTGRLGSLMNNTAKHMEEDVDGRLKAMISIVEPVMIVVMGGIVGVITLSVIIPMYSVVENIK